MTRQLIACSLLGCLLLAACSSPKVIPPKQAGVYFQEGEEHFEKKRYQDAIQSWEKVRDSFYSPELNALAALKIADAYYYDKKYVEAAVAYEDFRRSHPDSPYLPDVLYQLGLSYVKQMRAHDQDQTATLHALNAFSAFTERFPGDHRLAEARSHIDRCRNQLVANELYIGQFYLKTKAYQAAITRLEGLFRRYQDFAERDTAYYLLGQAYLLNGDKEKAAATLDKLFKEHPGSEHLASARKFFEKNS